MGLKASVEGIGRNSCEAAKVYLGLGLGPIPIPHGQKSPVLQGWPSLRLTETDLPRYFTNGENIGLLLGEASNGLMDTDLDCPEAVAVAEYILPTTLMSGREKSPRSHYWYLTTPLPKYRKFTEINGETILEIRGAGHQTVVPPSPPPEGDPYRNGCF